VSYIYKLSRHAGILVILLLSFQSVTSQEITADSILQPDSLRNLHSPRKAVIFSTLLPGLGQIYNKKYWKVPVIYATFGVLGYFIAYNNKYYKYFKGAYAYILINGEAKFQAAYPDLSYLPQQSLETGMNTYRRWRDLNALGFIAFYAIQVIDANVDAHFFNYDISQNISMNVRPGIVINDNLMGYAIGLKINLHF
jgi:hypothetical protein